MRPWFQFIDHYDDVYENSENLSEVAKVYGIWIIILNVNPFRKWTQYW